VGVGVGCEYIDYLLVLWDSRSVVTHSAIRDEQRREVKLDFIIIMMIAEFRGRGRDGFKRLRLSSTRP
jgi:hypothetical protein